MHRFYLLPLLFTILPVRSQAYVSDPRQLIAFLKNYDCSDQLFIAASFQLSSSDGRARKSWLSSWISAHSDAEKQLLTWKVLYILFMYLHRVTTFNRASFNRALDQSVVYNKEDVPSLVPTSQQEHLLEGQASDSISRSADGSETKKL